MKSIFLFFAVALFLCSCGGSPSRRQLTIEPQESDRIEVLYFHGKKRCAGCNAIEAETRRVVDSLHDKRIVMRIIDISQKENMPLADKYEVSWSSLIIDGRGSTENLTEIGFSYARTQPERFRAELTRRLTQMLEADGVD